jgi:stage V sporulation protein AF
MNYYNKNDETLAKLLNIENNFDVVRKEIGVTNKAIIYFLSSLADSSSLFQLAYSFINSNYFNIQNQILNGSINKINDVKEAFVNISSGMSLIIYLDEMYIVETRNYPSRSISEPDTERTIRGSKDGFAENIIVNIGLIRRRIKSEWFYSKMYKIGNDSKCDVVVCALTNKVNKRTLKSVEEKLKGTSIDDLTMSDRKLEEKLFNQGFNPFPLVRYSERPDIIAAQLLKGHIAIVVDTSSSVIIVPTTIFEHTKHVEEYRQVSSVGTFIRIIRYFAILISIFLVPLWMLTLTNENFISHIFVKIESVNNIPVLLQIILVELTIEILRIATIHTPNQLTSAMGLIATLILGQMAVEVGWFASEVLLFCSISSIGGFATPSYELSLANKIVKLILIVLVGLFGGAGFIIGVYLLIMFLGSISLFEVPYLYPLFPFDYDEYKKVIFRGISK